MVDFAKEIIKEERQLEKSVKSLNSWMIVSCVLAVLLVIAVVMAFSNGNGGLGEKAAGDKLLLNLNGMVGGGVTLVNTSTLGGLYEVNVLYKGQAIPVYITKDGKYMAMGVQEIKATSGNSTNAAANTNTPSPSAPTPTSVTKSAKPIVQAFVFSYCPYGLQFEKALSPVYDLLKSKADINVVFIGAMHGEFEHVESLRQLCIQKNYGKDALWSYLNKFNVDTTIGACSGDATCLAPKLSAIMTSLKINESKITTCMATDAEALYATDGKTASAAGVSGSPTFLINGAEVQVGRTAEEIKKAVCDAFTTAPAECNKTLSTSAVSPSFGPVSGGSASAASASCGA